MTARPVIQKRYDQRDYLAPAAGLPTVKRNADMKDVNRELTKRTLAEKSEMWSKYIEANIDLATRKAIKRDRNPAKFRKYLHNFVELTPFFQHRPVIVLGYGPSFHKNLELLKKVDRKKCRLIAAERCLPEMAHAGILPDAVTNLDSGNQVESFYKGTIASYLKHLVNAHVVEKRGNRYRATKLGMETPIYGAKDKNDISHFIYNQIGWIDSKHRNIMTLIREGVDTPEKLADRLHIDAYKNIDTSKIVGIFAITTNPDVRKWFRGRIFWFNPSIYPWKNTISWEAQKKTGLGVIPTCGNVGAVSTAIALSLGCQPIALLGMDFCHELDGMDASRMTQTEYQTFCPKCKTPHRCYNSLPKIGVCANKECGIQFDPRDPAIQTYCTNTSYKAYAFSFRSLIKSPVYADFWKNAKLVNLSGGILHGSFILKSNMEKFIQAIDKWDCDNDLARIRDEIKAAGGRRREFRFWQKDCVYEDDDGNYKIHENGTREPIGREDMTVQDSVQDDAAKPVSLLKAPVVVPTDIKSDDVLAAVTTKAVSIPT